MAADKLSGRMDNDIRTMLDGPDEIRRAEGIVNHQRKAVLMSDFRNGIDIRNVAVRIAQGFR